MQTDISIQHENINDIIVFIFSGELDETNADLVFSDIHKKINVGKKLKVIFDFADLKYLNSKAIGYVADTYGILQDRSGKFVICAMNESVAMVADIVGLQSIVPIFQTRQEALDSF
ncbi:STAS domain-containing protein [Candidatus Gracilibacteria bacterium]|nr:STAS domain-containing protein [Candidatus Gracilibacteria bacterium]